MGFLAGGSVQRCLRGGIDIFYVWWRHLDVVGIKLGCVENLNWMAGQRLANLQALVQSHVQVGVWDEIRLVAIS
jgi:hypothetical protein